MRCLYELLKRVPGGTKTMTNTMSRFLRNKGMAIVNENTQIQQTENNEPNGVAVVANPVMFIQVPLLFYIFTLFFTI